MITSHAQARRAFTDLIAPHVDRQQTVLTTCKAIHTNHVVYSVLLNEDVAFEVVLPVAVALVLVLQGNSQVIQSKEETDEALRQVNVPLFDALAHAFVIYSSLPKNAQAYLLRLAGGERTRLQLARLHAHRYTGSYLGI